jgi:hypothetical protein
MMASNFAVVGFFLAYLICGGAALWLGRREKRSADRDLRHGESGERRVARALTRAGYAVLTDLTVVWSDTSHQIDHIVRGRDGLYVIETKTWHGLIEGRAGDETWTLRRPRGRAAIKAYNPLFQNRRHAEVIGAMCGVPVTPLVVSAGFVRVPQAFSDQVIPLASLPARLGPVGPSSRRVEQAFLELSRRKDTFGQGRLSARHRRRMAHGHRFDPVRALWVASVISLACALLAVEQLATHHGFM